MCGRYTLHSPSRVIAAAFSLPEGVEFPARFNIAPSQPVAGIRAAGNGARELASLTWGLVPSWSRDPACRWPRP
jgi:putative SOS response-associated peptidase YedK